MTIEEQIQREIDNEIIKCCIHVYETWKADFIRLNNKQNLTKKEHDELVDLFSTFL